MKKKFTFLMAALMLLTMMVLPGKAVGQTNVTINFGTTTGHWAAHTDANYTDSNIRSWSRSFSASGSSNTSGQSGYSQFGNSSTTSSSLEFTASAGTNMTVTAFSVTMAGASGGNTPSTGTIYLYKRTSGGDETQLATASVSGTNNVTCSITSNVTFSSTDILKVSYVGTKKAIKISQLSYSYTTGSSGPVDLTAPVLGNTPTAGLNSVTVTWGAVTHATEYTLQYATNSDFTSPTPVEHISKEATSYTATSLDAANTYYFRLKAIGDGGSNYNDSDWSNTVSAQPLAYVTLSAPSNLAAEIGNGQVTLSWDVVDNATKYEVEYANNSSFTSSSKVESTTTSKTITGLTNGTTYYFRVKSIGNGTTYRDSDYGTPVNATPSNLVTITITESEITSFAGSYGWYTWTSGGISGRVYAMRSSGIQMNSSKQANCVYNTTAIPGAIKSIRMVQKSGTSVRSWAPTLGTSELTSPTGGTTLTAHNVDTDGYTWTVSEGNYSYFLLSVSGGATTITTIEIKYEPAPTYAVTINSAENGTFVVKKNGTAISSGNVVNEGASMTLTASPSSGYALRQWSVAETDGEHTVTVTNNAFTMPNYPITIGATFEVLRTVALAEGITGGTVTRSTEACLSDTEVTITANANSGYRFGSFTVTDADAGAVSVSTTDNVGTFTMPAKNVTVKATFIQTHTVTYKANGGTGNDDAYTYDHGTDVTVKNNSFTAPDGKYFSIWNTQADGNGDDFEEGATINSIAASYDMYAKWLNRTYHITFNVNGSTTAVAAMDIVHDTPQALPTPTMAGFNFIGWATTPNGTTYVDKTSYNPSGNEENITLYAVFGSLAESTTEITTSTSGVPSTYATDYADCTIDSKHYMIKQLMKSSDNPSRLQFKGSYGSMYNKNDDGEIVSIVLTYSNSTYKNLSIKPGTYEASTYTYGGAITPEISGDVYTYTFASGCHYFKLDNGSNAAYLSKMEINYKNAAPNTVIYGHDIKEADYEITTPTVIAKGAVLDMNGHTLTNTTAANLIIEDGGQLIIPSSGSKTDVKATFHKNITHYSSNKDNYYLIANPTTGDIDPKDVDEMVEDHVEYDYDLYYFDEEQTGEEWRNYRQGGGFKLENGKGYLYANVADLTLEFPGTVRPGTTATIELYKKGSGDYAGFNLVGNPLSNNVTSMMFTKADDCSYYKLRSSDGVFVTSTDPIIVGEAFMVEAPSDGATLTLNPVAKGEDGFNNEVIRLEVSNSKYTDVAFVYFGYHLPLTKINHLNDEAPMLYIHNENSDRAVEVYNNRGEVKSINVNFEAKTMGTYTISAKMVKGEIKYMHLYDRLTGIDTDLLVDDYSFIGAKDDQPGRFILNLESVDDNGSSTGSETFAYQSGDNIIVNGEGELQVFDVTGRMVMSQRVNGAQIVNGLNTGVYVFRMEGKVQKVVIR